MDRFMDALEQGNLETLRKYPKADLHNHFALGGSRRFLYHATGKKIEPLVHPLTSMAEMDLWSQKYIGQYFNSTEGRKLLIRATSVSDTHLDVYKRQGGSCELSFTGCF